VVGGDRWERVWPHPPRFCAWDQETVGLVGRDSEVSERDGGWLARAPYPL